jgi:uncharacterized protein
MKKFYITLLFAIIVTMPVALGTDIPFLTGRVNDNAQILSDSTCKSLTKILKAHELRTTNQIVILTISSLEGESIEDYSNKVFNEWKLGTKEKDNGVLIVIVPEERKMRIEVGYGLEGLLPDISAGRIIRNVMAPRFRDGDFNGGIADGTLAVVSTLEGYKLSEPDDTIESEQTQEQSVNSGFEGPDLSIPMRILLGAFIFGIIGLFTIVGILTPGVGWFLYLFLIPFWAMFPIIIIGTTGALICLIIYLIGYPVAKIFLKNTPAYKKAREDLKNKGTASIGGFVVSSGGSGSSWSSGSSSGGGFSGGGGSSGGGGASGGW